MSLTITSYPQVNVNGNINTLSKWGAVHHAILFGMHRQDYGVLPSTKPPGDNPFLDIAVSGLGGNPATSVFTIGNEVYIELTTGASGTFPIVSITNPNTIRINIGARADLVGTGYLNDLSRLNYFSKTNIWGVDASNQYYLIGTSENKPDSTGRFKVDVASYLKSVVGYNDEFLYDTLNKKDLTLGGSYNITYSENWQGFEGSFSGMSNTLLRFFSNSAKQIQDKYGANMGEYVPFNNYDPTDIKALFLSDFEAPTYFPGFPFSLSFIYSDRLAGTETKKHEEKFDVNNVPVALTIKELNNSEVQNVNRLIIDEGYPSTTDNLEVWLENDGTVSCIQYMAPGYVQIGYVQQICGNPIVADPPGGGTSTN